MKKMKITELLFLFVATLLTIMCFIGIMFGSTLVQILCFMGMALVGIVISKTDIDVPNCF